MMFDIYSQDVKIGDQTYTLRPLSGRFLPKLYAALGAIGDKKEISIKDFDEATVTKLHEIVLETFKKSYPKDDPEKIEEFVSQNLLQLIGAVIQVNLRQPEQAPK